MVERIDSRDQVQNLPQVPMPDVQETQGEYRGERVILTKDATSMIQDAAEELSFAASETVEKKITKRKIGKEGGMKSDALEKALSYLKKLPEVGKPERFQQFFDHLKKMGTMSPQQLVQESGKFFKDISQQFAGLSFARDMLSGETGNEDLKDALRAALDQCLKEHGPAIRAGLNMSAIAAEFSGQGLGAVEELRNFYRDTVLRFGGLKQTYDSILANVKEADLPNMIQFLIKAAGIDLQSQGPSISPAELKKIVDDLYQLQVLGNIHRDCSNLLGKMERDYGLAVKLAPRSLMERILTMKEERWLKGDQVLDITHQAGVMVTEAQIDFLRGLKNIARLIPLKAYDNVENREKFIDAVQEAMDSAIEKEDQ